MAGRWKSQFQLVEHKAKFGASVHYETVVRSGKFLDEAVAGFFQYDVVKSRAKVPRER